MGDSERHHERDRPRAEYADPYDSKRRSEHHVAERLELHERIARALGWTVQDTIGFSLPALRDLVRPLSATLAADITLAMEDILS